MNTIRGSAKGYRFRSGIPRLTLCFAVYLVSGFLGIGTALAQQQPISIDLPAGKDVKVPVDGSLKPVSNEERGKRAPALNDIIIRNRAHPAW